MHEPAAGFSRPRSSSATRGRPRYPAAPNARLRAHSNESYPSTSDVVPSHSRWGHAAPSSAPDPWGCTPHGEEGWARPPPTSTAHVRSYSSFQPFSRSSRAPTASMRSRSESAHEAYCPPRMGGRPQWSGLPPELVSDVVQGNKTVETVSFSDGGLYVYAKKRYQPFFPYAGQSVDSPLRTPLKRRMPAASAMPAMPFVTAMTPMPQMAAGLAMPAPAPRLCTATLTSTGMPTVSPSVPGAAPRVPARSPNRVRDPNAPAMPGSWRVPAGRAAVFPVLMQDGTVQLHKGPPMEGAPDEATPGHWFPVASPRSGSKASWAKPRDASDANAASHRSPPQQKWVLVEVPGHTSPQPQSVVEAAPEARPDNARAPRTSNDQEMEYGGELEFLETDAAGARGQVPGGPHALAGVPPPQLQASWSRSGEHAGVMGPGEARHQPPATSHAPWTDPSQPPPAPPHCHCSTPEAAPPPYQPPTVVAAVQPQHAPPEGPPSVPWGLDAPQLQTPGSIAVPGGPKGPPSLQGTSSSSHQSTPRRRSRTRAHSDHAQRSADRRPRHPPPTHSRDSAELDRAAFVESPYAETMATLETGSQFSKSYGVQSEPPHHYLLV